MSWKQLTSPNGVSGERSVSGNPTSERPDFAIAKHQRLLVSNPGTHPPGPLPQRRIRIVNFSQCDFGIGSIDPTALLGILRSFANARTPRALLRLRVPTNHIEILPLRAKTTESVESYLRTNNLEPSRWRGRRGAWLGRATR